MFLLSNLVTDSIFMSIPSTVPELWQLCLWGIGQKSTAWKTKIGKKPVWGFPNIYRLRQVWDTKFGRTFSNEKLLNAAKFQFYSCYLFWVIRKKPIGGSKNTPLLIQVTVKDISRNFPKLFKYFNGGAISTSFVLSAAANVIIALDLNYLESVIAGLSARPGSSLKYCHKPPYIGE